jgi:hypothetical protein
MPERNPDVQGNSDPRAPDRIGALATCEPIGR